MKSDTELLKDIIKVYVLDALTQVMYYTVNGQTEITIMIYRGVAEISRHM